MMCWLWLKSLQNNRIYNMNNTITGFQICRDNIGHNLVVVYELNFFSSIFVEFNVFTSKCSHSTIFDIISLDCSTNNYMPRNNVFSLFGSQILKSTIGKGFCKSLISGCKNGDRFNSF